MREIGFYPADILLPDVKEPEKWSVVACDQYTAEPKYWDEVRALVGDAPSTLNITLPEVYLEEDNVADRIGEINRTMTDYLNDGVFRELKDSLIYLERTQADGSIRRGLVGRVDLEQYDYRAGSRSLIRATEGTVLERIPPRVKVRENAALELPHIMMLIDDAQDTVIGPLRERREELKLAYQFQLMQGGGSVRGWSADGEAIRHVTEALEKLSEPEAFAQKYGVADRGVMLFAMGDGNHSLATAKECFERLKAKLPEKQWKNHPARYALVEVVNVHDAALQFEPIHRVLFQVEPEKVLNALRTFYQVSDQPCEGQSFICLQGHSRQQLWIQNPSSNLAVGTLQRFIDAYLKENGGKVDYIHGEDVVESLSREPGNLGFLLPNMEKSELFATVLIDGVLPRKTFSMGHACDKRFYLECRKIK